MKDYKIRFKRSEVQSSNKKKKGGLFMRHKKKIIGIVVLSLLAVVGYIVYPFIQNNNDDVNGMMEVKFKNLQDLTVQESNYNGEYKIEDSKKILGWKLPMTTNVIRLKYKGRIKVAYTLEKPIKNDIKKTLTFDLGKPRITDNYIVEKKVYDEETTLLNKIEADQVNREDEAIKEEGKQLAIEEGLYEKADKQMKATIMKMYEDVDYKIIIKNSEGENNNEEL